ncbi:MAG: hypothetical protein GX975_06785 [Clostridiales bacterium]|nr:hypothetical protein [Clostridiales bacterium]
MKKAPAAKRIPAILLALLFVLTGTLLSSCKFTETVTIDEPKLGGSIPKVGEIIYGFKVAEIRDYAQLGAKVCLFNHEKTGARIVYIANDDPKKACALSFKTAPADDSGACNILRHALLRGSDRFPEGPALPELAASNLDINFNSFVLPKASCYTLSCFLEDTLLEYAERGIDACFKPIVFNEPAVFDAAKAAALEDIAKAEGFSNYAYREGLKLAFKGAPFSYDCIGTQEGIEYATLRNIETFYKRYYRASNCLGMLYGNFEDYTKFLALADSYFVNFDDAREQEQTNYEALNSTLVRQIECPAPGWEILPPKGQEPPEEELQSDAAQDGVQGAAQDAEAPLEEVEEEPEIPAANSCVFYAILLGNMPDTDMAVWDMLNFVVADESAPIMKKLAEIFPREDFPDTKFSCKVELSGPEPALIVFAERLPEDGAKLMREAVDAGCASIAEGEVRGYIGYNIQLRALNAGSFVSKWGNVDTDKLCLTLVAKSAESGNPLYFIDYTKALGFIGDWNTKGTFAKIFKNYTADNKRKLLLTVHPLVEEEPAAEEAPESP